MRELANTGPTSRIRPSYSNARSFAGPQLLLKDRRPRSRTRIKLDLCQGLMLRRHGIVPAPAYRLGWSRFSCIACIFGNPDQWASMRYLAPDWFERIAAHEDGFGRTIQRDWSIRALADRGRPYQSLIEQPDLARKTLQHAWNKPVTTRPDGWTIPAGAFGNGAGPARSRCCAPPLPQPNGRDCRVGSSRGLEDEVNPLGALPWNCRSPTRRS